MSTTSSRRPSLTTAEVRSGCARSGRRARARRLGVGKEAAAAAAAREDSLAEPKSTRLKASDVRAPLQEWPGSGPSHTGPPQGGPPWIDAGRKRKARRRRVVETVAAGGNLLPFGSLSSNNVS